jgi:quercetin dioxygenase-like cupin family protein
MKTARKNHRGSIGLAALLAGASVRVPDRTPGTRDTQLWLRLDRHDGQRRADFALKTLSATHQVRISTKGASDVHIASNVVVPGGQSGWHTHPGPSIVIVKTGRATVYDGDDPTCTPHVYEAGSSFFDPGDGHVHLVRNENSVTLETVAFQIVPAGSARRIDAPAPGYCGF